MRWALRFGGTGPDAVNSVALDASGNIYVTGNFSGVANFGNTNLTSGGSTDVFVAKVWPDGAVAWVRRFGEQSQSFGNAIAVDATGAIVVAGSFQNIIMFGERCLVGRGGDDMFVVRLDANGLPLWAQSGGGNSTDKAQGVGVDAAGNVYVGGYFNSTATFGETNVTTVAGGDGFLCRYGSTGQLHWVRDIGGNAEDYINAVSVDAGGQPHVVGQSYSSPLQIGATNINMSGTWNAFAAKFTSQGQTLWALRLGSGGSGFGNGLALDAVGNLHWCGYFSGGVNIGSTNIYNPSGEGLFVSRWSRDLPAFSAQSVSLIVMEHTTVTLSHSVTGTGPFTVQWTFNGTNLPGATNAALVLSNLQPGMAGDYSVWVSGPAGSTLSQSATVTLNALVMRPAITVIGSVGRAYRIEFKDSAAESSWTTLTNFALPIIPFHHVDFTAEGHPRRFYRVTAE